MSKNSTKKPVRIPITLNSEYSADSRAEEDRLAVESLSSHLGAIFYFIKMAVRGHDYLDLQTETRLLRFDDFREHLQSLCEVGDALAAALRMHCPSWNEIDNSVNIIDRTTSPSESPRTSQAADFIYDTPTSSLAFSLSKVLRDPELPEPLLDLLRDGLTVFFNEHIDKSEIVDAESSADYIQQLINGYWARQAGKGTEVRNEKND